MFFPELWSLANHQASATQLMDDMYAQYRAVLKEVIKEINPKLKPSSVDRLALFISASIEGHTVFIGHGKPWQKQTKKTNQNCYAIVSIRDRVGRIIII